MYQDLIKAELEAHRNTIDLVINQLQVELDKACQLVVETIQNKHKVILFGNGGSAADAQHIAAEFTGRFVKERKGLPAIALTTDTSALTAIGNDYGFDKVFSRQVEALAQQGDLLIGISTSGNSANVLEAYKSGKELGCKILSLTGRDGGSMKGLSDLNIIVPSNTTARIQEMHILIGHILCTALDNNY
jgi:D-sedoheptulose 7-phosphate isomerase